MRLNRVTITGADDSISPADLVPITERFPWVEWGILLSKRQEGSPRFPTTRWIERLLTLDWGRKPPLSGHLCGAWVRDLCAGGTAFWETRPTIREAFSRIQLNFHAEPHEVDAVAMADALNGWPAQIITQEDNVNRSIRPLLLRAGFDVVPLFDTSGGAGIEPAHWPVAIPPYCGYAGGLSPHRLPEQLAHIREKAGDVPIWIDVETHVRTPDDQRIDLLKVFNFLKAAEPWVHPE